MALLAFFAETALVNIIAFMAAVTLRRCFAIFFAGQMAGIAGNREMLPLEGEIGTPVIKGLFVELDDIHISAFMVCMT